MTVTPREVALDFLRVYVHRGDSEEWLRHGHMSSLREDGTRKDLPPSKVIVYRAGGVELDPPAVFSLHDLYEELRREAAGAPVQTGLL